MKFSGRLFANESVQDSPAPGLSPLFSNEKYLTGEKDNWVLLAPYGEFPNQQGLQVFSQQDAVKVVQDFRSIANIGVRMVGIPFYIGHPDHPLFKDRYQDTRAYGRIKQLDARPEGLFGNVKWSEAGKRLIEAEAFHGHSVNWRVLPAGAAWHPVSLKSVGFTNEPNIEVAPITHANEKQMKKLAAIYGLPETATEAEIEAKAQLMANELATAQPSISVLKKVEEEHNAKKQEFASASQKITKLEGEKTTLANEKQTLTQQVETLTTERDNARTGFANERKARTKAILDQAIVEGRITAAERPNLETLFANEGTFDTQLSALTSRQAGLHTGPSRVSSHPRISEQQDRMQRVAEFCNEEMRKIPGLSYDEAFAKCQRDKKEWFSNMQQPEHAKNT